MPLTSGAIFEGLAAVATLGAAAAAAISAYISSNAAKAAQEAVKEARLSRKAEVAPRLMLEKDFGGFHLQWPHPEGLNGGPAFFSRKERATDALLPTTFSLTNHGGGPALEVRLVFEFEDPNDELDVPEEFASLGLAVWDEPATDVQPTFKMLEYRGKDGRGSGLPLYIRTTVDLPNCAPSQMRTVDFPQGLLNRLFLRGLQQWVHRGQPNALRDLILTVRISCHTAEGDPYETQFRFRAFPFWSTLQRPLVVYGHFFELPMYPKPDEYRVI